MILGTDCWLDVRYEDICKTQHGLFRRHLERESNTSNLTRPEMVDKKSFHLPLFLSKCTIRVVARHGSMGRAQLVRNGA